MAATPPADVTSGSLEVAKLQISESYSKDVQLLLWAVGEARGRGRRRDSSTAEQEVLPGDGSDYFTEWQPATR